MQLSDLRTYLDGLVPERPFVLQKMEQYAIEQNFPIIGPASGQCCYLIAKLIGARSVYELGSGFGYSTAWFAQAVKENGGGVVHHVVWDAGLSEMAKNYLTQLALVETVEFEVSEAIAALKRHPGPFDLIFNDIDKAAYPESLASIDEKLRPGGVLIVDNMLWGGRVLDHHDHSDETVAIRKLTEMLTENENWISSLIPIRDGLMVAMKKPADP